MYKCRYLSHDNYKVHQVVAQDIRRHVFSTSICLAPVVKLGKRTVLPKLSSSLEQGKFLNGA